MEDSKAKGGRLLERGQLSTPCLWKGGGASPSSKQTNEHSVPLFRRKHAWGLKWYLRSEKKRSRAQISRSHCQQLIWFPLGSVLYPCCGPASHPSTPACALILSISVSQRTGCRQHPVHERIGNLPGFPPHPQQQVSDQPGGTPGGQCQRGVQRRDAGSPAEPGLHDG